MLLNIIVINLHDELFDLYYAPVTNNLFVTNAVGTRASRTISVERRIARYRSNLRTREKSNGFFLNTRRRYVAWLYCYRRASRLTFEQKYYKPGLRDFREIKMLKNA